MIFTRRWEQRRKDMSKLKEKLTGAVKQAKSLKPGDDMWDDMFYVTKLEQDVDSIIDAVIEVLPGERNYKNLYSDGFTDAITLVKLILEEAKSNSN